MSVTDSQTDERTDTLTTAYTAHAHSALRGKKYTRMLKGCSTVRKIVIEIAIEIGMEQTRLLNVGPNRFHYADFRD